MIGPAMDRGGLKDSENAPNSIFSKINESPFWRFGTEYVIGIWPIWGLQLQSFMNVSILGQYQYNIAKNCCLHVNFVWINQCLAPIPRNDKAILKKVYLELSCKKWSFFNDKYKGYF